MTVTVTGTLAPAPPKPVDAPVAPPARRRRWLGWVIGLLGVAAVVAAHLALAAPVRVPIIHPDELGYLLNARVLAKGGLRSQVEYYPGFSVLLIPLWLVAKDPLTVFRSTLIIQAGLSGAGALLAWWISRAIAPDLGRWRRLVTVGLVCAYPSFLLYSDLALSEVAFTTVYALVVVLAAAALPGRRMTRWAALGVASGLLVAVHPRGLAVVVATLLLGVVVLGWRKSSVLPFLALVAGATGGLAVSMWLVQAVRAPATVLGAYQPDGVLSKSLSAHGLSSLAVELAGQLFYLSVATCGLVPLALVLGLGSLWRVGRGDRTVPRLVEAYATLAFLGVWALSSLFMNLGDRADKLVYGRYNEGVIVPLLLIAASAVLRSSGGTARRWLVAGLVAVVGSGAAVDLGNSKAALFGAVNPVNVLGLAPILVRMGEHIHVLAIVGIGAGAVFAAAMISWRLPAVALLLVAAVFVASAIDTETGYVVPGSRARAQQDVVATAIAEIREAVGPISCIGYDPAPLGYGDYNYFEDQFLVPDQPFALYNSSGAQAPCGTLVISRQPDFAARHPGAREVTAESYTSQTLWALPGAPLFTALAKGGWLSPGPAASPLPAPAFAGGRVVAEPATVALEAGSTATAVVRVQHGTGGAPWPAVVALHSGSGTYGVRLTVQAYAPRGISTDGTRTACVEPPGQPSPSACSRVELPTTVLPGQELSIPVRITAAPGTPAGTYALDVGLVQEGVGEFATHERVTVVVSPAGAL